ncbi:hypothetical protein [Streptomyces aureocirculatus]|uniref:hypothetical protein n=1 Tax=Streptomyces aureocirculatus TaxID=67275 RepID=UPI00068CE600
MSRCAPGLAGTAVACAFLAKQTGGAVLVPVVWLLWGAGAGAGGAGARGAGPGSGGGCHFFGHYFLQLTPPLALLGTVALQILPRERTVRAVLASACVCSLFVAWGLFVPRPDLAHAQRLAAAVQSRTSPGDRVLFWGMHPETYWLADRVPASRYLSAGLLTNYSGGRDGPRVGEEYAVPGAWGVFRAELAARPPAVVVDDSRGKPYGAGRVRGFRRVLSGGGYERVGVVGGAVVYTRGAPDPPLLRNWGSAPDPAPQTPEGLKDVAGAAES